ncbi:ribonucleotide-diphosphate reductase subunit beta [Paenibacillus sp. AR247]|uniref:ribonucleotide-diphosphate reductase subunit beta n=1 Tax=Paenibacillus sp. AR247 TaxID=1631599 RepID=UPI0035BE1497
MQFWTDDEIPLSDDKMDWIKMTDEERTAYKHVLGGLTLLDTLQGGVGMPKILEHVEGLQRKAVLGFMSMMEQIHAKSYSSIFTTLASTEEIDAIFRWVEDNEQLAICSTAASSIRFTWPARAKMTSSGEIIDLIIRDESIHGLYVGTLAQELFQEFSFEEQEELRRELYELLETLYQNEVKYTDDLYSPIGLQEEVKTYVRYNANKALMNLGFEPHFPEEPINPIVFNGISTHTKQHDFFSKKGNGYVRAINIEPLSDDDFVFDV